MKRYFIAFALILCLLFTGCTGLKAGDVPAATDDAGLWLSPEAEQNKKEDAEEKEPSPAATVPPGQYPDPKCRFNENGMLKLISGGETILPCEHEVFGQTLTSYSGLGEEGISLSIYLPKIYDLLPVIDRAKGFAMEVYEWGSIYLIDVFDASYNMIAHRINEVELYEFIDGHNGELIIDVQIFVPGCEIFEEPTERQGTGYAFIVCEAEKDAEASAENEPFLRLYSAGAEVETFEFFCYGTSAYYEEGVPKGMLCADGEAFFDPNYVTSRYDELPVYSGCRLEGLDIRLCDGARIVQIFIYDPAKGFERTMLSDKAELDRIIAESAAECKELAVEIVVLSEGDYIEELGESESRANGYAFIVK